MVNDLNAVLISTLDKDSQSLVPIEYDREVNPV